MGKHSNYVLQPRGKALYEDESSFGSRMLLKMGWSKGKGLGANENGTQDFIRVKYKNDIGGIGFSARDDQWTENELTFNALLKNLNEENGEVAESGEEPVNKIKSLEEKSKKSRSRVHYQKFTRGKDLSRYSEKDLANIFGKKTLNESYKIEKEDESSSGSVSESTVNNVEDIKIINTGVSITDYFKSKRQKIVVSNEEDLVTGTEKVTSNAPEEAPKKKMKSSKSKSDNGAPSSSEEKVKSDEEEVIQEAETFPDVPDKKKRKKESKRKSNTSSEEENFDQPEVPIELPTKNSKKRRHSNDITNVSEQNETKKQKNDPEPSTSTTITVGADSNKFFLDAVAVEKLKYLRLEKFKDSNVANIVGYGLSKDIKLEVCDSSIVKGISHVNKYSIYANVDKMHSKKYYKSLLLRYHKKRNTFKI